MLLVSMPGGMELVVIALVLVLLFGGAKIPALMKGMGQGIREFKKELRGPPDDAGTGDSQAPKAPRDKT